MIQKLKTTIFIPIFVLLATFFGGGIAMAATAGDPCPALGDTSGNLVCGGCTSQGCVWIAQSGKNDLLQGNGCAGKSTSDCLSKNQTVQDLNLLVNFLASLVGIVVVGMLITGGIQYSMAGNNPERVKAARTRITNALVALVVFMLSFGFLNWLIPGGIFK